MGPYYSTSASTTTTWAYWVYDVYSTASTSSTVSQVWNNWTSDIGTSSYTTTDYTYTIWVQGVYDNLEQKTISAEERKRNEEAAERARKEREKLEIERKERERKAYLFLMLCLNNSQKQQLEKNNYFELEVAGGRRYRINKGQCRNIQELDKDGKKVRTLCFHPKDNLHDYDAMAIQKLALEADEAEALKVANFS
jgi:hypothetical protein